MDFSEVNIPLTLKQVDSLYWLGRYSERVLTTMRFFMVIYDSQLDNNFDYAGYCQDLDIYNGFSSLTDFCHRYAFDKSYASSIVSSITRAYDNAIMLRDTIGSDALSYIEMAQRCMQDAEFSQTPMLMFQKVIDYIMAFNGTVEDAIIDRNTKNIIRCGAGIERLDMYLRLDIHKNKILHESRKLASALAYTDVKCDSLQIQKIIGELCEDEPFSEKEDKMILLQVIDGMFVTA